MSTPPLPAGYALDSAAPPLPAGYALDQPAKPGILDKANEYAGKALSAAGLPTSISDIPNWMAHFIGVAKDSKPAWDSLKKAIEEPTHENIVNAVPFIGPASVAMSKDVQAGDFGGAFSTLAGTVAGVKGAGQVEPGLKALSKTVLPGAGTVPEKLYQSALKPPPGSYSTSDVQGMVKTGLDYNIPVSSAGVDRINSLVRGLNNAVQAQIDAGEGGTVNKYSVASRLGKTAKQFATQVNPEADLGAVGGAGNEFLRNQPNEIPVSEAQKLKVGTYRQLGDKAYGELSSATIEAQKALARGIKEELEQQFPEIKGLNAKESELYDLQPALERAVRRIDNHDIIGLGSKVVAGAGAVVGGAPGAVAGSLLEKVLGMPMVKSRIAIRLHRAGIPMDTALARVGAYTTAVRGANPQSSDALAVATSQ